MDSRTRLRQLGQVDLGLWVEAATQEGMWSIQREIAQAVSKRRSRVTVPSCNASGKTWLAARIALAFYDSFTPGTPCILCKGPCGGSKVITTSSKFDHLKDNMWGEIRLTVPRLDSLGVPMAGRMMEGDNLTLKEGEDHFIIGHNPKSAEGMQGYHAPHKLIIGDEATALDEQMTNGITRLLASADSRLFMIANPTTPDTWFARMAKSPNFWMKKIRAWDTPAFTGEEMPEGASLLTPEFLEDLKAQGMGPGSYEWTTMIEADFWDLGEDVLITEDWYEQARKCAAYAPGGTRQLGVDLASYGSAENVIAFRDGNVVVAVEAHPAMPQEVFWSTKVLDAVKRYDPHYLVYDADGVGAGVSGYAMQVQRHMSPGGAVLPFRGALSVHPHYNNARSGWWWALRNRFEKGDLAIEIVDPKLQEQITSIRYSITQHGKIRVESKEEMRKQGRPSPDRGDAVMYSFALSEELPIPGAPAPERTNVEKFAGVQDRSDKAMWERDLRMLKQSKQSIDPVWGVPIEEFL